MKEVNADFAGEMSGHIFFHDRWPGFDDGVYASTRLLEILTRSADANAPLKALPNAVSTPELQIPTEEGENVKLVETPEGKCQVRRRSGHYYDRRHPS
mgnify:CR=1 FL=1